MIARAKRASDRAHAVRAKADYVKFFESLVNCVNSLQTCLFTMFAEDVELLPKRGFVDLLVSEFHQFPVYPSVKMPQDVE